MKILMKTIVEKVVLVINQKDMMEKLLLLLPKVEKKFIFDKDGEFSLN
jgi:hypothetical protein